MFSTWARHRMRRRSVDCGVFSPCTEQGLRNFSTIPIWEPTSARGAFALQFNFTSVSMKLQVFVYEHLFYSISTPCANTGDDDGAECSQQCGISRAATSCTFVLTVQLCLAYDFNGTNANERESENLFSHLCDRGPRNLHITPYSTFIANA